MNITHVLRPVEPDLVEVKILDERRPFDDPFDDFLEGLAIRHRTGVDIVLLAVSLQPQRLCRHQKILQTLQNVPNVEFLRSESGFRPKFLVLHKALEFGASSERKSF